MLVWPPMPLQPLDEGADRKFAHSDRLALAMTIAPAARRRRTMNASRGRLPASAQEPAVVGIPVVSTLSLTMTGIPRSGPVVAAAACPVGGAGLREGGRADRDHGVERRVQLPDPVEVELDELDRRQAVAVHRRLQLRDRRGVDVDAGHSRRRGRRRERRGRRAARHGHQQGDERRKEDGASTQDAHRGTSGARWIESRSNGWGSTPNGTPICQAPGDGGPARHAIGPLERRCHVPATSPEVGPAGTCAAPGWL